VARRVDGIARAAAHAIARSDHQRASTGFRRHRAVRKSLWYAARLRRLRGANFLCADDRRPVCAQTYSAAGGTTVSRVRLSTSASVLYRRGHGYSARAGRLPHANSLARSAARARRCADLFSLEKITPGLTCEAHFI